jgi:hypothetical protein
MVEWACGSTRSGRERTGDNSMKFQKIPLHLKVGEVRG